MPEPADVRHFRRGAEWALAAATALELGVIEVLSEGPAEEGALAERLALSRRGTRTLLGALEALGAVRTEPDGWRLTGAARGRWVDPDTPDHEAGYLRHWLRGIRRWAAELPDAIRAGEPPGGAGPGAGAKPDSEELARFMAAMADKDPVLVEAVVSRSAERAPGARQALDVGGGPGTFARALAERGFRVTLLDRPEVVELVGSSYGLDDHPSISLVGGDFLRELPEGPFDLVLLANITHIYDPPTNADLVRRCAARLAPGGALAILDFVRGLSEFAALFAITMLLHTEAGDTYGPGEYRAWLEAAGLEAVRFLPVSAEAHLITAVRAAVGAE